jgi:hypothetical protein
MKRWRLPIAFAACHLLVWVTLVLLRPPLPSEYFQDRDSRIEVRENGAGTTTTYHLINDVDPLFIFAQRAFGGTSPWDPDWVGRIAVLADFPAAVPSQWVPFGPIEPAVGGMGWRKASWATKEGYREWIGSATLCGRGHSSVFGMPRLMRR